MVIEPSEYPEDITVQILQILQAQPIFICLTFGLILYGILLVLFMLNEHAHVRDNPKLQYHLARIKDEELDFVTERRHAFQKAKKAKKANKSQSRNYRTAVLKKRLHEMY